MTVFYRCNRLYFQCYHCISIYIYIYVVLLRAFEGSLHVPRQDASMEGKVEKDKLQEALYCNFETLCLENSPIYRVTSVLECAKKNDVQEVQRENKVEILVPIPAAQAGWRSL